LQGRGRTLASSQVSDSIGAGMSGGPGWSLSAPCPGPPDGDRL